MLLRRASTRPRQQQKPNSTHSAVRANDPLGELQAQAPLVLVVDDVEDNRDLYATYLAYAGFRVEQAADGEEALSKITIEKPDLIVMDLAMPRMDGWEATRLIKSNPRTHDINVLVITGHATSQDLQRAKAMGADALCTKPCLPQDLLERVRTLLGLNAA